AAAGAAPPAAKDKVTAAPLSSLMNSRRLMGRPLAGTTPYHIAFEGRAVLCITANSPPQVARWVMSAPAGRGEAAAHVRFAPIATELRCCSELSLSATTGRERCSEPYVPWTPIFLDARKGDKVLSSSGS